MSAAPTVRRRRSSRTAPREAHHFILDFFDAPRLLRESLGRLYESAGLNEHKFLVLSALATQTPTPHWRRSWRRTPALPVLP